MSTRLPLRATMTPCAWKTCTPAVRGCRIGTRTKLLPRARTMIVVRGWVFSSHLPAAPLRCCTLHRLRGSIGRRRLAHSHPCQRGRLADAPQHLPINRRQPLTVTTSADTTATKQRNQQQE
jgi:hypothetical protein